MAHCISPDAEKILDKKYKVLNKGFVRLVDYMGNDERIVQSARVSYGKGTKSYRQDKGLINYLLRNDHTSPFEQVVFTFHIKLPIFVARQWIRHRTARVNEISGRYSIMNNEFYVPSEEDVAFQSTDNKQGRSTKEVPVKLRKRIISLLTKEQEKIYSNYEKILDTNIAKELARINLPLSLYTEWYWQIDLHNLFHFLALRLDGHAQKEIRDYAVVIQKLTKKVCPIASEAFEDHIKNSVTFSKEEIDFVRNTLKGKKTDVSQRTKDNVIGKLGFEI